MPEHSQSIHWARAFRAHCLPPRSFADSVGIHAEDTRDRGEHNGAEKIMIFQPAAHFLHMQRPPKDDPSEGWYWQNKPQVP